MASGVIFAELHTRSGEHQDGSDLVGVATSPVLSFFKRQRGQLFTVVEPSLPGCDDICHRLIQVVEDEYFKGSSRSIITSLRQAISAANERLRAENSRSPPTSSFASVSPAPWCGTATSTSPRWPRPTPSSSTVVW